MQYSEYTRTKRSCIIITHADAYTLIPIQHGLYACSYIYICNVYTNTCTYYTLAIQAQMSTTIHIHIHLYTLATYWTPSLSSRVYTLCGYYYFILCTLQSPLLSIREWPQHCMYWLSIIQQLRDIVSILWSVSDWLPGNHVSTWCLTKVSLFDPLSPQWNGIYFVSIYTCESTEAWCEILHMYSGYL